MTPETTTFDTTSTNKAKHQSSNPLMVFAIQRFHATVRAMLPGTVQRVLEVGCGEGFSSQDILAAPGRALYGGDLFASALVEARARIPAMRTCVFDAVALPYPDGAFDAVMSLEVMEHLNDPVAALAEMRRVTRRYLLLSVPNDPVFRALRLMSGKGLDAWGDHPEHIQHWTYWSYRQFLRDQGLTVQQSASPFPFAWSIMLCDVTRP